MAEGATDAYWTVPRLCLVGAYAALILVMLVANFVIVPVILSMICYSAPILYIASHNSLSMFAKDPETGEKAEVETVSSRDAMLFPFIGSAALFSLYVAYKFFGKYWVNLLLTTYISILGAVAVAETFVPVITPVFPAGMRAKSVKFDIRIPFVHTKEDESLKVAFGPVQIVAYILAACVAIGFLVTKNWCLHNIFGVSFSLQAIEIISLTRFPIAFILLSGLFFYDIFWVFGTDVMVSVATKFDGPIKIIFPVAFDPWKQSILGLGDIVMPGIFVAMCLRFDAYQHMKALKRKDQKSSNGDEEKITDIDVSPDQHFAKPYFLSVWVSYILGLLTTGFIMFHFNSPQPALLYLVPFTMFTSIGCSLIKGQFKDMLRYNEEDFKKKEEEEKKEEEKKDK